MNPIHKSRIEIRISNFSFKNHSILSKVMRFHNLGHISLKKEGKIDEFPHFLVLVQKVGAYNVKENSGKMESLQ